MRKRRANTHAGRRPGQEEGRAGGVDDGEKELLDLYRSLAPPLRERLLAVVRLVAEPSTAAECKKMALDNIPNR